MESIHRSYDTELTTKRSTREEAAKRLIISPITKEDIAQKRKDLDYATYNRDLDADTYAKWNRYLRKLWDIEPRTPEVEEQIDDAFEQRAKAFRDLEVTEGEYQRLWEEWQRLLDRYQEQNKP